MTNLDKLLENGAFELADALIKECYDVKGNIVWYYGPNNILYSIYDPCCFDIAINMDQIKDVIFSSGSDMAYSKNECRESILEWLKQSYTDEF